MSVSRSAMGRPRATDAADAVVTSSDLCGVRSVFDLANGTRRRISRERRLGAVVQRCGDPAGRGWTAQPAVRRGLRWPRAAPSSSSTPRGQCWTIDEHVSPVRSRHRRFAFDRFEHTVSRRVQSVPFRVRPLHPTLIDMRYQYNTPYEAKTASRHVCDRRGGRSRWLWGVQRTTPMKTTVAYTPLDESAQ